MYIEIRCIEIEEVWVASLNGFNGTTRVWEYGEKGVKFGSRGVSIGFTYSSIWYG